MYSIIKYKWQFGYGCLATNLVNSCSFEKIKTKLTVLYMTFDVFGVELQNESKDCVRQNEKYFDLFL